jgi:hypothetical protein
MNLAMTKFIDKNRNFMENYVEFVDIERYEELKDWLDNQDWIVNFYTENGVLIIRYFDITEREAMSLIKANGLGDITNLIIKFKPTDTPQTLLKTSKRVIKKYVPPERYDEVLSEYISTNF